MESVVTKINKFIEFTPEQKERAATVDLEEFLLRQGEKLIKSGREKRLASDHSVTVRGCEWFDHGKSFLFTPAFGLTGLTYPPDGFDGLLGSSFGIMTLVTSSLPASSLNFLPQPEHSQCGNADRDEKGRKVLR